jgi:hypothetical protein
VLGNGELLGFDSPDVLLSDSESQFASLVDQTGAGEAEHLRMLANAASKKVKLTDEPLGDHQDDELTLEAEENDPLIG